MLRGALGAWTFAARRVLSRSVHCRSEPGWAGPVPRIALALPSLDPAGPRITENTPLLDAAFSPDGSRLVATLEGGAVQVWDTMPPHERE